VAVAAFLDAKDRKHDTQMRQVRSSATYGVNLASRIYCTQAIISTILVSSPQDLLKGYQLNALTSIATNNLPVLFVGLRVSSR
jgi:hypothetical protein